MQLDLSYRNKASRKIIIQELKVLCAVNFQQHVSKDDAECARVVGVSVRKLSQWKEQELWREAQDFWGIAREGPKPQNSLEFAEVIWTDMVSEGNHLNPNGFSHKHIYGDDAYPSEIYGIEYLHIVNRLKRAFAHVAALGLSAIVSVSLMRIF